MSNMIKHTKNTEQNYKAQKNYKLRFEFWVGCWKKKTLKLRNSVQKSTYTNIIFTKSQKSNFIGITFRII